MDSQKTIVPEEFKYDIFLCHSTKDKAVVRPLAERLRKDGVKVWFDEWEIKPGDSIPAKIEEGLERSRVLVFCMSANSFGADWAQLESGTFRFRDPQNKERRFLPLRLDDAPIKGSLAQFSYIDWLRADQQSYGELLETFKELPNLDSARIPSARNEWFTSPPPPVNILRQSDQYYSALTSMVTSSPTRKPLFVSVGTADFVSSWITRIAIEKTEPIQVTDLVIVRERDDVVARLEHAKMLHAGFLQSLRGNISRMKTDASLRKRGISLVVRYWRDRSPFHGYLYGDRMLIGRWESDCEGFLHVRTPLHDAEARSVPEMFHYVTETFATAQDDQTGKP